MACQEINKISAKPIAKYKLLFLDRSFRGFFFGNIRERLKIQPNNSNIYAIKKPEVAFGLNIIFFSVYCRRKVIGILKGTRTARPLCFPGVILGSLEIILAASFSKFLSGPRIRTLVIAPSFAITNCTYTLP